MKLISCLFAIFSLCACGNFFRNKSATPPNSILATSNTVAFADVKSEVFEPHCIKCHANYSSFASVKQIASSILSSVEQNRMPKNAPPLAENLKTLLRTWIAEGANEFIEENSPALVTEDETLTLKPTWTSLSLHIFEPKCLVCHNPTGQAPWVDISSRAAMAKTLLKHINFKDPEQSNLIVRLRDPEEPMPPPPPQSNLAQLTEKEVNIVIDWINAGLP